MTISTNFTDGETHQLSPSAKLLYLCMLDVFNRAGWPDKIQLDNMRITILSGASTEKSAIKARDELIRNGIISYRKGNNGKSGTYWLSDFHYIVRKQSTNYAQSFRGTSQYRNWRIRVLERDHYTCQICGTTSKQLNVHHIERYAKCPEKRIEMSNGITLCEDCHKLVHKKI